MKRNDYSNYNRGQEISGVTFQQHQNQVIETLNSVMLSLGMDPTAKTVLWGLENSGTGTNYDVSAGAIFTQGEIFLVDAFSGTSATQVPVLNPVTLEVGDPVRFADGSIEAVHLDHKYQISLDIEGAGEVNFSNLVQLKDVLSVMLDVDSKLSIFKNDIIGGASEGFDTLEELENALVAKADQASVAQLQADVAAANTYTDTKVAELTVGATDLNTFAKVEDAAEGYQTGGASWQNTGTIMNYANPIVNRVFNHNEIIHFNNADIPFTRLSASIEKPRVVKLFCDFHYSKQGTDNDSFDVILVYKETSNSVWQPLRGKSLFGDGNIKHCSMRAHLQLVSQPGSDLQFGLKLVHSGGTAATISAEAEIEFDTIY